MLLAKWNAAFPLTPALSPGERENGSQRGDKSGTLRKFDRLDAWLPLPEGEGWGEGKVRSINPNGVNSRKNVRARNHICTVTPVSPSAAHVTPPKAGTSFAIWLNKPSMFTKPF